MIKRDYINLKAYFAFLIISLGASAVAAAEEIASAPYIAGLSPYERPANAGKITKFRGEKKWEQKMLKGIDEPRTGLEFIADQGSWYTPFNQANMPRRYDIRGMYLKGN